MKRKNMKLNFKEVIFEHYFIFSRHLAISCDFRENEILPTVTQQWCSGEAESVIISAS